MSASFGLRRTFRSDRVNVHGNLGQMGGPGIALRGCRKCYRPTLFFDERRVYGYRQVFASHRRVDRNDSGLARKSGARTHTRTALRRSTVVFIRDPTSIASRAFLEGGGFAIYSCAFRRCIYAPCVCVCVPCFSFRVPSAKVCMFRYTSARARAGPAGYSRALAWVIVPNTFHLTAARLASQSSKRDGCTSRRDGPNRAGRGYRG
ncbi:hypothetical protein BKA62DRAFT_76302 [Auriculariales sp. MPI-PUGE-AT-0066]|nr:hypothetical protein BKA62DRAFT_76302 [Auriculariales sp. MPI-PUGE-AT-0066]